MTRSRSARGAVVGGVVLALTLATAGLALAQATTAGPGPLKVRVALAHRVLFDVAAATYVAQEKKFFEAEGVQVEAIPIRGGGAEVMQAITSGDIDVGVDGGAVFATLSAFEKGAPIKAVGAGFTGLGDIFWYVKKDSPIRRVEDLSGKKLGISYPGSSTDLAAAALAEFLKAKGLPPPQIVETGSPPDQFIAVQTSQIDSGWSAPPFFFDKVAAGEIRIVFRPTDIPGKLQDAIVRFHLANASFAAKNPEALRRFFRAYHTALDFAFQQRAETVEIWSKRAGLKLPKELAMKVYDFYTPQSMALKPIKGLDVAAAKAVELGFLKKPLSPAEVEQLIDLRYLP